MNLAYLSLGSNIDPEINLPRAAALLRAAGRLRAVSPVFETAPVGTGDPRPFLNAAVILETALDATTLKRRVLADVEARLGRVRDPNDRNAPRTIDVDISLWQGDAGPPPDPDILLQVHVAVPLAAVAPELAHPETGESLAAIAARLARAQPQPRPRPDVIIDSMRS